MSEQRELKIKAKTIREEIPLRRTEWSTIQSTSGKSSKCKTEKLPLAFTWEKDLVIAERAK